MSESKAIVLFDGVCNFCNFWVNFAIKRDPKKKLRFTTLQGEAAGTLLPQYKIAPTDLSTVVVIENGKAYTQSSAALRVARHLSGGWKLFYGLIVVPKFIRDGLYNIISRYRYKWFGKKDVCMIPTPELKERFLE
jgi:predicted DCC family thiol-disulfide oxidoreductase YuxK